MRLLWSESLKGRTAAVTGLRWEFHSTVRVRGTEMLHGD
jgi:hypothetical protein